MGKKKWVQPEVGEEKIRELALGVVHGDIFTSMQLSRTEVELLPIIFMPLMLAPDKFRRQLQEHPPTIIYAKYKDQMGNRGINGYPIFSACGMLYKRDAELFLEKVKALMKALEAV